MPSGQMRGLPRHLGLALGSLAGVGVVTLAAYSIGSVNQTTAGFAYLLLVLVVASNWGFAQAVLASIASTFALNFCFLPPVGTLTIADPQNWIALFAFLATGLIASRLSDKAERRAQEAIARRRDIEDLYSYSRSILLTDDQEPFPRQLARRLAQVFPVTAVVLFDRRSEHFYRAGPSDIEGLDDQILDAARLGTSFFDPQRSRTVTAVRLGSEPIGALALQGPPMPDSVLQGIANLVAIGLERARAHELAHQVEAVTRSERLRQTLLDAMSHEFKTPLTSIRAATSALLADPAQFPAPTLELVRIADEEARRLQQLIDDSVEMARLEDSRIAPHREPASLPELIGEVVASLSAPSEDREIRVETPHPVPGILVDRRLVKLALKQLLDNALKYSTPMTPISVRIAADDDVLAVEVTNHGAAIPSQDRERIFERFYRGASAREMIPGSGLGLSIAAAIARAHDGDLSVAGGSGATTFRLTFPLQPKGA